MRERLNLKNVEKEFNIYIFGHLLGVMKIKRRKFKSNCYCCDLLGYVNKSSGLEIVFNSNSEFATFQDQFDEYVNYQLSEFKKIIIRDHLLEVVEK